MDGTVSVLNSEIGERVVATGDFAGTEVMRVANLASMEARVDVNENDVVNVEAGDEARVKVDAYPDTVLNGTVRRIASTATVKNEGTPAFRGARQRYFHSCGRLRRHWVRGSRGGSGTSSGIRPL